MSITLKEALEQTADAKELFSVNGHRGKIAHLLRHFSDAGLTLEIASDARHLNRSIETLKQYCRVNQIQFSDYVPMSMRPLKPEKPKKEKKRKAAKP